MSLIIIVFGSHNKTINGNYFVYVSDIERRVFFVERIAFYLYLFNTCAIQKQCKTLDIVIYF